MKARTPRVIAQMNITPVKLHRWALDSLERRSGAVALEEPLGLWVAGRSERSLIHGARSCNPRPASPAKIRAVANHG